MHNRIQANKGFTLVEMSISVSILTVVSLITFMAIRSSTQSSAVTGAKEEINSNLQATMLEITQEVRQAYTQRTVDSAPPRAPEEAFAVTVTNQGRELRFCTPVISTTSPRPGATSPIVMRLENEDLNDNGKLDNGEDANGDGALTRRIVRVQDGETFALGAANTISDVTFTLAANSSDNNNDMNTLLVRLEGSKAVPAGTDTRVVSSVLESRISMEN